MTTEKELLKAIFANPAEDTPRMLYADWLEENGDPDRAAFIRTQIGLARGNDPSTGETLTPKGRRRLQVSERKLRQIMIDSLGKEITDAICSRPHRITFDRGFIQDLDLGYAPITSLPEGLQVGGTLYLFGTRLTSLPDGLQVGGTLSLSGTPITSLPEGLQVGGGLYLRHTPITSLPKGLQVGGGLYLTGTPITSLPERLQVGGDLNLFGTQVTSLPVGLQVGGDLDLGYAPITSLSEGLKVRGNLNLTGTPITEEAARRIPEMPGLSTRAKITGLRSAGYEALAEQVERNARRQSDDLPPL